MLHHGRCYYPENCPCAWLGLEYLPGETVETPCYKWYHPPSQNSRMSGADSVSLIHDCLTVCDWEVYYIPNFLVVFFLSLDLPSVCHRGYFNCSYSPCPAVCTVYSDRHYHTFDGLEYDYHTDCQVYLLKVSLLPPINVISASFFFFFWHALVWLRMWPGVLDTDVMEVFMSDRGAECVCVW